MKVNLNWVKHAVNNKVQYPGILLQVAETLITSRVVVLLVNPQVIYLRNSRTLRKKSGCPTIETDRSANILQEICRRRKKHRR